jgi:hypothetical protein
MNINIGRAAQRMNAWLQRQRFLPWLIASRIQPRMYLDFRELLAILNAKKVRYLVVGGYAVSFHAQPRATKDLDLWVKPDLPNANALYAALAEFGAPLENLKQADFAETGSFFRMGVPPLRIGRYVMPTDRAHSRLPGRRPA